MPVSKLKNLAILILLMANLILAMIVVPGRVATARETEVLHSSLCTLYDQQQIALDPETIPDTVPLYVLELQENSAGGIQAATALLGEQVLAQDDSSRYLSAYQSDLGTCAMSRSGEFSAQLTAGKEQRDLEGASGRILKKMGFAYDQIPQAQRLRAGVYTVSVTQQVLGVPVFSGDLVLTWSNSRLSSLEGLFFPETGSLARVSDSACLSAADALVAFLSARYDLGWVGSAVTGLEQGYIRSETAAAAAVRLTPVWRLETDTGSFQINGMTGEVTAV